MPEPRTGGGIVTPAKILTTQIGPHSCIREVMTADEHVISARPVSLTEARRAGPVITPPDGYLEREQALTTRRALLRLLTQAPNTVVTRADVCRELGRVVGRVAVSTAAKRLRRDMAIEAVPGGGYVYLVPVPASGEDCCDTCGACAYLGCLRLHGRPVDGREWCWGWRTS